MKKVTIIFLMFIFAVNFVLPAYAKKRLPIQKTQLEIREMQTHVYNTSDTNKVFKASINTLQDEGYTILNIEDELGYILAKKEFKEVRIDKRRMAGYYGMLAYYITLTAITYGIEAPIIFDAIRRIQNEKSPRTVIVDSNVTIESFGKRTKVRFTLIEKELENADGYSYIKSSPRKVIRMYNPLVFQTFFEELDKSLFYEKI